MDRAALRVPTVAVAGHIATVREGHLAIEEVDLFVEEAVRRDRAHVLEDLAKHLDEEPAFVPVRPREGSGIRLVGKHAIAWVAVARRDPESGPPQELSTGGIDSTDLLYDRQYRVEVELAHGQRLEGLLLDNSPSDQPRVIDHLNLARHFVRLWTPGELVLVNKLQIVAVHPPPEIV